VDWEDSTMNKDLHGRLVVQQATFN
jgi:hypothetical protein